MRQRFTKFIAAIFALSLISVAANAEDDGPGRLIVGLDLSASNPLVLDNLYANKAAKRVGESVASLSYPVFELAK